MNGIQILVGDCRETLKTLPDCSVHCVVTSPPYFGLRDYGCDGQIGLEATPDEFVAEMVSVFREVRRVLRDDGTCWLNLGDSYAAGGMGEESGKQLTNRGTSAGGHMNKPRKAPAGLKPKDLIGIPWMVAFALRADGWWLRQDIIWHKPNPMPESVNDRCTKAHEYIFLLTKSERYFFDQEAIKEPVSGTAHSRGNGINPKARANETGSRQNESFSGAINGIVTDRNKRSVWTVTTKPYGGAHFATFPPDLIEPCILAGTSEHGCCPKCGAPWERMLKKDRVPTRLGNKTKATGDSTVDGNRDPQRHCTTTKTVGWEPGCKCTTGMYGNLIPSPVPCTVLDPFGGSGTTGEVARACGCYAILCELNPEYVKLQKKRLNQGNLLVSQRK